MSDIPTTTTTPDYGEPLRAAFGNAVRDRNGQLTNLEWALRDRAIACMNACAGMADPPKEIAAMRDVIREAGALFDDFSKVCNHKDNTANAVQLDWIVSKSCAVLAKLQPFITP